MIFSYAYSRYVATARDSDFINNSTDFASTTRYIGPNGLDRKQQFSFGGTVDLPFYLRVSLISHFYSPLPDTLLLPSTGSPGDIFKSDVTGDGTGAGSSSMSTGDVVPGSNIGSFGRDISASQVNTLINNYNTNMAGTPTPAGQALLQAGLFTGSQLALLKGVQQTLQQAPQGQVGLGWLKALDLKVSWPYKVKEYFTIEPSVSFFNIPNFANYDGPNNLLSGVLDGSAGSLNGTTAAQRTTDRLGLGSGVFGLGSPRVLEFGLRITF